MKVVVKRSTREMQGELGREVAEMRARRGKPA
jgi:hypothetical protein